MGYQGGKSGSYWTRVARRPVSRRNVLRAAGAGVGIFGLTAVGCGSNSNKAGSKAGTNASVVTGGAAGTAVAPAAKVVRGGRLRIGVELEPSNLDPQVGTAGYDHTFVWSMHENLVSYDDKFNPMPQLADKWELADPQTITFTLKPGVKFHDGTDFNAEAVKANIARVIDPATTSTARGQILVVDSVQAPDANTAVFKLKTPSAPLILNLSDRGGMMMSPTAIQKYGSGIGRNPVGTGAFKFQEWTKDSHVTVRRNENYWGKDAQGGALPYLDEIVWQVIPEEEVRLSNLNAGQLDVLDGLLATTYVQLKDNKNVNLIRREGFGSIHLRMNLARPPIDNINLRRALAWGLDREAISKTVHLGLITTGVSPIGPAHQWAFYPELQKQVGLDLTKAKQFLQAGGMPDGYSISAESTPSDKTPEVLKEQWAKLGINLNIDPQQVATKFYSGNDDSFVTTSFSIRADPDGTMYELYSKNGAYNAAGRLTKGQFVANPALEDLLTKAQQTYDLKERAALYHKAEEIIVLDAHGVFWGWLDKRWAVGQKVQGFVLGGEGKGHYTSTSIGG
jgi:peptide/nickel transport system substrate-binding protein